MIKKILIVGDTSDNHLKRFKKYLNLQEKNNELEFEAFNVNMQHKEKLFEKNYHLKRHFPSYFYKIKTVHILFEILDCFLSFNYKEKYDLINIHFLTIESYILLPVYKRVSKKIMISPWGSDVYRIYYKFKSKYQKIYDSADFISVASDIKFKDDVREKFNVPDYKFVNLGFGSEMLDVLIENKNITKTVAKKKLIMDDSFIITCGYNSSSAHNHLDIIDALVSVKVYLPKNTLLFFPMTYGPKEKDYILDIENKLIKNGFSYKIFNNYLSEEEQLLLRVSTDLFIHIQDTDANSATIQEYLFCKTDIINGDWLRYPHFEKYGMPYYITESKKHLSNTLKDYFLAEHKIAIPEALIKDIKLNSWSYKIKEWYQFYLSI